MDRYFVHTDMFRGETTKAGFDYFLKVAGDGRFIHYSPEKAAAHIVLTHNWASLFLEGKKVYAVHLPCKNWKAMLYEWASERGIEILDKET